MDLQTSLRDSRRFLDQIDRLHEKNSRKNRLYDLEQEGVPLASLCMNRKKVARVLAQMVGEGRYELNPARLHLVSINGKLRKLYHLRLTDLIVHGVVAEIINEAMREELSKQVYSYQKGVHWWQAASDFARFVRKHRRSHLNPKDRGLYVLRRDIREYTDSIPVSDRSPLWLRLQKLLHLDPNKDALSRSHWLLIQHVIRPETCTEEGASFCNTHGVPTGSPISTMLFNFYLMPLDQALATIPGGFYARYSDDLLFAHPDAGVAQEVSQRLSGVLRDLNLQTNNSKDQNLFFNGAGRPSTVWEESKGTTTVAFLGCEVSFEGVIALKSKKVRELLREIKTRMARTLKALPAGDREAKGRLVCSVINEALDPGSACRQKSAALLHGLVTSRTQLKQIDYSIARIIVTGLTGDPSVKAFRKISYRTLRKQWNLVSLLHRRNLNKGNAGAKCHRSTDG